MFSGRQRELRLPFGWPSLLQTNPYDIFRYADLV